MAAKSTGCATPSTTSMVAPGGSIFRLSMVPASSSNSLPPSPPLPPVPSSWNPEVELASSEPQAMGTSPAEATATSKMKPFRSARCMENLRGGA
jgi:hypothetical protein